jgi:hypothetical protein
LILKQVFYLATEVGVIIENPSKDIKHLSEKGHERNKYLLPPELDHLVSASHEIRCFGRGERIRTSDPLNHKVPS